ncbi:uncharacterized protein LOC131147755 [Malania oleifera]|uniref:uncharacterized protein LOC131147755 n=1 Tax=Malania oleifera TaxID=397392 RepID=UPI0025AD9D0C|nr:uncharacterized protein LOC131147755 [Malania oleifera]XP_057953291.1 uncharacterized protein LOC131147755 [Malania oleifera]XP_057953292.1 uncharacterized protein LOC131147755 [Malania oleifera]XP_057953293.1 uncharacterized protein LOC131147755 [Malania oleifera]XP_057953294.1 uncharacterized protein LOC131147755 [Malania oleifera]
MSAETSFGYKFKKRVKLSSEKSNGSKRKEGFGGTKKGRSGRSNVVDAVLNGHKFHKRKDGGKRNLKSSIKDTPLQLGQEQRNQANNDGKSGSAQKSLKFSQKRKRIYAKQDTGKEAANGTGKLSNVKQSAKAKTAAIMNSVKLDGGEDYLSKKKAKSKSESSRNFEHSQEKNPSASSVKFAKRATWDKKKLDGGSDIMDDKPKKRKRVIRIDPHDISNKRLDDGIVNNENTKEKKEDLDKKMSMNAQFRAIQPSPSILSFVEDNLLGRRRLLELRRSGYNIELSAPLDNVPFSTSSERERIGEPVFRNKLAFFAAAKVSSSFPPPDLAEIAFAGRSNVGKSSLLNALTRQWGVVRTSDKPGHTQTINFFKLGSKLCLVDLPGYGFAYAKEEVKDAWEELVKEYVSTRVGLKRVCLLIDTKWGMKPRDCELIHLMERSRTKYQIVLTKTDMVFPVDVARRAMQIEESLKANKSLVQPVMMVSSKSGAGIKSLRTAIAKIARFVKL